MAKAIGIDLGTTNTVVAVLRDGRPQVLEDAKGYRVLPSVVSRNDDGSHSVGHGARNRILTAPDRTVYAIKRLIGRRFDSEQAAEARTRVGYQIREADDGGCEVLLGGDWVSPVEVSAEVLRTARELAERAIGEPVEEAVITVPAYFNHQQRSETMEAAHIAGLRCDRLVNEPTAAALAYGFRKDIERTIVVFDLGGGTFDVSVLHLSRGVYEILSSLGDTYLGGEDFDYRVVDYLADHFQAETGYDLRQDQTALQRIKDAAERAKCELSFTDKTTVLVPRLTAEHNLELQITRLTLESLVEDLVERALDVTRRAVSDAGLQLADVDDVILVGGQTRMPRVREAISGLFGKEPGRGVHPEEVVAIGAAVHAASFTDEEDAPRHVLIDVTPFDLGMDVAGGLFQAVVPRNANVPASETRTFATTRDNQDTVKVTIRQGESRFADENEFLGEFVLSGLTKAPRMETKVDVTFRIDSNGMLHVSAVEQGTGEARRVTVRNYAEVAQGGGASAQLEGDVATEAELEAAATASVAPASTPSDPTQSRSQAREEKRRGGFLASLFGRSGRKSEAPPPDQPPAQDAAAQGAAAQDAAAQEGRGAAPTTDEAEDQAAAAAAGSEPATGGPAISLPELGDDGLEDLDESGVFDVLEPEDHEIIEPAGGERAASVGMAGGPIDAWADDTSGEFAMPAYDEDEDEDLPVGLAGEPLDAGETFALPEDLDEAAFEAVEDLDSVDDAFAMPAEPEEDRGEGPTLTPMDLDEDDLADAFAMPAEPGEDLEDVLGLGGSDLDGDDLGGDDLGGDELDGDDLGFAFAGVDDDLSDAFAMPAEPEEDRGEGPTLAPLELQDGFEEEPVGDLDSVDDAFAMPADFEDLEDGLSEEDLTRAAEEALAALGDASPPASDEDVLAAGGVEEGAAVITDDLYAAPPAEEDTSDADTDDDGIDPFEGLDDLDATQSEFLAGSEPDTSELFELASGTDLSEAETLREGAEEADSGEIFGLPAPPEDEEADSGEIFGLPAPPEDEDEEPIGLPGEAGPPSEPPDDLFRVPDELRAPDATPTVPPGDDEKTEIFARSARRKDRSEGRRRRRKPARLKLAYRRVDAMVSEYRENLRRGGCFVKTNKPLPVGRECVIEVRAPGLDEPLSLQGVVTWSSVGLSALPSGQDPGMGIEYRLDAGRRAEIEQLLSGLGG